jgi:hypothetical protein
MESRERTPPSWMPSWLRRIGTAAWACDPLGNVGFLNEHALRLFGTPPESCEPVLCHRLVRGANAAGERICRPNCPVLARARQGGRSSR